MLRPQPHQGAPQRRARGPGGPPPGGAVSRLKPYRSYFLLPAPTGPSLRGITMLQALRSRRTAASPWPWRLLHRPMGPTRWPGGGGGPRLLARRGCQGPCCPGCGLPRGYCEEHHLLCRRWHGDFQRLCCTYLCRAKSRRPWGDHQLSFERFPAVALSKTYNTNQQTADSAGTMTAMITGVKTWPASFPWTAPCAGAIAPRGRGRRFESY